MAAPGYTGRIVGLRNLFIAPLSTDTTATTAYGTAISMGAQSRLTFQPVMKSQDLETSQGIDNTHAIVTHMTWSLEGGEINLEVWDAIFGGKKYADAVDSKNIYTLTKGSYPGYIGVFGQPDVVQGSGAADFYLALMKCKVENPGAFELGNGWAKMSLGGRAFYTLKDQALFTSAFLEAITTITAAVALADVQDAIANGT